jgi:hypothetical protein
MRRAERKHRTPVVKTIKVTVGSQSASFRLKMERLIARKAAIALMRAFHAQAKSLTTSNPTAHPLSPSDFTVHFDIEPDMAMDWRVSYGDFPPQAADAPGQALSDVFDAMSHGADSRMDEALVDDEWHGPSFAHGSDAVASPFDVNEQNTHFGHPGTRGCLE